MRQDQGSLGVLLAGYLALAVLLTLSVTSMGLSLVAKNRIQAVADSAILYAHDRAVRKGIPERNKLVAAVSEFLEAAPSAQALELQMVDVVILGGESQIQLCAKHSDPIGLAISSGVICRSAKAKSFLVD